MLDVVTPGCSAHLTVTFPRQLPCWPTPTCPRDLIPIVVLPYPRLVNVPQKHWLTLVDPDPWLGGVGRLHSQTFPHSCYCYYGQFDLRFIPHCWLTWHSQLLLLTTPFSITFIAIVVITGWDPRYYCWLIVWLDPHYLLFGIVDWTSCSHLLGGVYLPHPVFYCVLFIVCCYCYTLARWDFDCSPGFHCYCYCCSSGLLLLYSSYI